MKIFDYEDIQLIPAKGIVNSRSAGDTSLKFGDRTFK
ncbi:MAG: GMP reductase, partial [Pisciglobus halotolerans]|nr:GMP reductase [Pisciglobus halotolerans]